MATCLLAHIAQVPVSVNESDAHNPLSIIRSIYRPGDFISFKLDIDNSPLELELMRQIKRDPVLKGMIGEMMFEMHYDHPDVRFFGHPPARWARCNLLGARQSS